MATAVHLFDSLPRARSGRAASGPGWRARLALLAARFAQALAGLLLVLVAAALVAALVSYSPLDPSLNMATARAPANLMGAGGALVADALLQGVGLAAGLPALLLLAWGLRLAGGQVPGRRLRATGLLLAAMLLLALAAGALWPQPVLAIDTGAGGLVGLLAWKALAALPWPAGIDPALGNLGLALLAAGLGLLLLALSLAVNPFAFAAALPRLLARRARTDPAPHHPDAPGEEEVVVLRAPRLPPISRPAVARPQPAPVATKRVEKDRQPSLLLGDRADLPPLSLLAPPPAAGPAAADDAALAQNARLLEGVLEDFGVRGAIIGISQGPVVTLYELEPAPGIKASRVIGLADDIARSMSAVSARVAVIPGRNVIGIELPNRRREMVVLSELISSAAFERSGAALPIVLGKDISGAPVIADLAPMPHLLIAGTTGSGKSVGLNAMILSLLYRLRPDECRMILIDPKMLELSVYDGIPHLLAPVVTEPSRAIRALKWAVEQMEDRYRNMAHINARSLNAYNERVREAQRTGKSFSRKVQTGFDAEGRPEYEDVTLPLEPLPLIVVVVDEMADLMMTAGKEVEFLIQRLAQKARAAGIHLIMATQRPSVDVITGVIKANLPTRISFQVTSKIDSRTILGEQGAEALLGKGDMLYMPGSNRIIRVHGPFVSDAEVEAVADHWRAQGSPTYVEGVTEEPDGPDGFEDMPRTGGRVGAMAVAGDGDLLSQAIQVVASSRKATISYLQRTLRVGYNSAARLIDQMQDMGLVSAPDHVGRREVLMDEAGNRLI